MFVVRGGLDAVGGCDGAIGVNGAEGGSSRRDATAIARLRRALYSTEEEAMRLQGRVADLERDKALLREQLAGARRNLESQEGQLRAYEGAMMDDFDRSLALDAAVVSPAMGAGTARTPLLGTPGAAGGFAAGAGGSALSSLRALMGEAYLLKMALAKRQGGRNAAHVAEVAGALDEWIMSSHRLKKAVGGS